MQIVKPKLYFFLRELENNTRHFFPFFFSASNQRCFLLFLPCLGNSDPLVLSMPRNYGRTSSILWKTIQYYFRFCHFVHCKHNSRHFKASSFAWKKWLKVINDISLRTLMTSILGNVNKDADIISVSINHCHKKNEKHYCTQKSFDLHQKVKME